MYRASDALLWAVRFRVSVRKTTKNKYLMLMLLAGDIEGYYVEFIRFFYWEWRKCITERFSGTPKL